ncbi:MAG: hypothetical protein DDT23_01228 [candidate division WS2 bacterium]|nr:hypothetical protein [Candidatus Lithacetigena glycinireducens]
MKERNIITEATTWALEQSGSRARKKESIQKAVEKWLKGKELIPVYLSAVERERETLQEIPAYAQYRYTTIPQLREEYRKFAGTIDIPDYIEKAVAKLAYHIQFASSRLRKRYQGENMRKAGIRTEDNGNYGWSRVVWHYADYSATISPDQKHIWIDYGKGFREYQILTSGGCVIGRRHIRKPEMKTKTVLKPHHLRRLYESAIRGNGIVWRWNTEEKAGAYIHTVSGESYHTPAFTTEPKKVFREAVRAFRLRRNEKKRKEAELKALEKVYVTAEDSVAAGNCRVRTENFQKELTEKYGMPIIAISATALLAIRDDNYTRRAVRYAMQK